MLKSIEVKEITAAEYKTIKALKDDRILAVASSADKQTKYYGYSGTTLAKFVESGTPEEITHWTRQGALQPASAMIRQAILPLDPAKEADRLLRKQFDLLKSRLSTEELAKLVAKVTGR